ncbi:hypothetical protein vBBceSLY5_0015 [Bacillus phage vB_BceS_LY5]|uniref:hypothetical protein n=1 Tax=Bacillus phage vB_BceS_LY5 TaxID=2996058 RepID=UPI004054EBDB|nr:hypothetical protein vBBceSLY5_0015 [Bacillus phage vB_BceS_LY5]
MSKVVQFNFEKNNDKEIEINGTLHTIPMDDDSKDKYVIATKNFGQAAEEFKDMDFNMISYSDDEIRALTDRQREVMKNLIEAILGKGTFKTMYALAGKSVLNLMPLAQELIRLVSEVDPETYEAELNNYLKNGKK